MAFTWRHQALNGLLSPHGNAVDSNWVKAKEPENSVILFWITKPTSKTLVVSKCLNHHCFLNHPWHKRTERKILGGSPTQSPLFISIFAKWGQIFARLGVIYDNFSNITAPSPRTFMILDYYQVCHVKSFGFEKWTKFEILTKSNFFASKI